MGRHSTTILSMVAAPNSVSPESPPSNKRKRDHSPTAEIEVDITAPEPPSKKALRRAKKDKTAPITTPLAIVEGKLEPVDGEEVPLKAASERSEYGIWIGNLPWTATKTDLREFLTKNTEIKDATITRLHMPPPSQATLMASRQKVKPQNKGFAYVDLATKEALTRALALSEKLLMGRRVLIKDSKSFEGRPETAKDEGMAADASGKPPNKRIFVGNLGFDTTKEDIQEQFKRCGEVLDVHIATFEDTGKCKGYAWVEFEELAAAVAAVRGWVEYEAKPDPEEENEDGETAQKREDGTKAKKKPKTQKWWVNKLQGRPLRMEFAEDKAVRYKKRYGKDGTAKSNDAGASELEPASLAEGTVEHSRPENRPARGGYGNRRPARKVDARTIKPGAALSAAPRLTGGIVESQGKKTTFV